MAAPIKTVKLQYPHSPVKVDVAVWEGRAHEGQPLPSSLSIRLNDLPDPSKPVVYLSIEESAALANVLLQLSFFAQEHDSKRRIEAWKIRQQFGPSSGESPEGKDEFKPANDMGSLKTPA